MLPGPRINHPGFCQKASLKVPCSVPFSVPILGHDIVGTIADTINNASNGTLKIKLYAPGELLPSLEVLDTVISGKTNAGYTAAFYYAGFEAQRYENLRELYHENKRMFVRNYKGDEGRLFDFAF
nr:hypothetical protein [uncultured Desulfobacter sp.]